MLHVANSQQKVEPMNPKLQATAANAANCNKKPKLLPPNLFPKNPLILSPFSSPPYICGAGLFPTIPASTPTNISTNDRAMPNCYYEAVKHTFKKQGIKENNIDENVLKDISNVVEQVGTTLVNNATTNKKRLRDADATHCSFTHWDKQRFEE